MMANASRVNTSTGQLRVFQAAVALGTGTVMIGFWYAPQQTWANLLLVTLYLTGLGLGGLVWLSLHYLTGARWSEKLKAILLAMSAVLPVAAFGLFAVLLFRPSLYAWTSVGFAEEAGSPLRHIWLTRSFFLVRAAIYLGAWLGFAVAFLRTTRRLISLSGAFLVVFGITVWLASHDWIMSLEPEWTSTVFSVYNFAGLFLSSLAATIVLVVWHGIRADTRFSITEDQLQDLGKLLFAFSSFWMYLWFCQYWLIWYVNNPEETAYFLMRSEGNWPALGLVNLALNWGIPFCVLLSRNAKRNAAVLASVAFAVLIGRWLDLYLMILPSQSNVIPAFGFIEAGLLLGAAGVFLWAVDRALGKSNSTGTTQYVPGST
jgi:hypothetical protein